MFTGCRDNIERLLNLLSDGFPEEQVFRNNKKTLLSFRKYIKDFHKDRVKLTILYTKGNEAFMKYKI